MEERIDSSGERRDCSGSTKEMLPLRVTFLTNCVAPYTLPVWRELSRSVESLQFLFSTVMESGREWDPGCDGLNVHIQRSLSTVVRRRRSVGFIGFSDDVPIHFPYDTLPWLWRLQPDVVISVQLGFRTLQAVIYRLFSRRKSRLVIWADLSEHTEREIGRIRTAVRRLLLRAADAVLVNGTSGARYVLRLGVPSRRIVRAPYTTDMGPFRSIPLGRTPTISRRLLYVGRLVELKGLEIFLRALVRWAETHTGQNCDMWFVGDGPIRKYLGQFPMPPTVNLRFIGNVPYTELAQYFAQAGILVLPTLEDTWGLVVNEALAAGLPVLGSPYSQAVNELVQDNVNGWIFQPDNSESMQDALSRVFATSSEHLSQMRSEARRSISYLTPALVASRFVEAIQVAMNEPRAHPTGRVAPPSVREQSAKTRCESGE
jgi:glycosyltransferase involved in cell wall biosynthesis